MASGEPATSFRGKRVFITGVCGTVGTALLRHLQDTEAAEIVGIDANESRIFDLAEGVADDRVRLLLGDIRDRDQLIERFEGMDVVLHAAAFKHVGTCEGSPRDAVSTNVLGTQNIIDAARRAGVEKVLFTSSDKAVNPTSVMGTSKLLAERLITAAASQTREPGPVFAATRFGNVLGSSGSVIPVFAAQIAAGGPVTLTDRSMNRFVMTLDEAMDLVLDSVARAEGGEIFVTKMHAVRIPDLAQAMIEVLAARHGHDPQAIEVRETGARPGEKYYEELINGEEARRVIEIKDFYVILPALATGTARTLERHYGARAPATEELVYRSDAVAPLEGEALSRYLVDRGVV